MIDFSFTQEQELMRRNVRRFFEDNVTPRVMEMDESERVPPEVFKGLADLGILGMTVSPEYEGIHADPVTAGVVAEEVGWGDLSSSLIGLFVIENTWPYIMDKYGSPNVKERVLPKLVKGKLFMGIATTEPDAGSDLANLRTTARREGGDYIVNGEKMYISGVREVMEDMEEGGGYLTLVKTAPELSHRGITLLYTPIKNTPGVTTTLLKSMGRRAVSHGGIAYKNVKVPEEFRIGEENKGFYIAMEGFDFARGLIALAVVGTGLKALELAVKYISERQVFGKPLSSYQGIQFKLAEHYARLESIRTLAFRALWMYGLEQREKKFSRLEVTKLCASAKMLATVEAFEAINDAMQWFGAYGYTRDCPLEAALRGVRSYMWAEGAVEIMKHIVARQLLTH